MGTSITSHLDHCYKSPASAPRSCPSLQAPPAFLAADIPARSYTNAPTVDVAPSAMRSRRSEWRRGPLRDPGAGRKTNPEARVQGTDGPIRLRSSAKGRSTMRYLVGVSAICMTLCGAVAIAQQNQFPLAAPAGVDSKAREVAPPGAVNQGPYD